MMPFLAEAIDRLAPLGLQIHIWPVEGKGWQANVATGRTAGVGWSVAVHPQLDSALEHALYQALAAKMTAQRQVAQGQPVVLTAEEEDLIG